MCHSCTCTQIYLTNCIFWIFSLSIFFHVKASKYIIYYAEKERDTMMMREYLNKCECFWNSHWPSAHLYTFKMCVSEWVFGNQTIGLKNWAKKRNIDAYFLDQDCLWFVIFELFMLLLFSNSAFLCRLELVSF